MEVLFPLRECEDLMAECKGLVINYGEWERGTTWENRR